MLVISRKPSQSFFIGENIEVKILEHKGYGHNNVRIGIIAPDDIKILRAELIGKDEQKKEIEE